VAATPALAQSPSFDCSKARLPDEFVICQTPQLAELDNLVASGYAFLKKTRGEAFADEIATSTWRQRQACQADARRLAGPCQKVDLGRNHPVKRLLLTAALGALCFAAPRSAHPDTYLVDSCTASDSTGTLVFDETDGTLAYWVNGDPGQSFSGEPYRE
jgi:hypothetical protein